MPQTAAFSSPENTTETEALGSYSEPSVLAIVALLFGLLSPLGLVAKLLMAISLVGAALAILALRKIAASGGRLVGRGAALVGLALSVACACASPTRDWCTARWFSLQAQPVAERWIELLKQGETARAFALTTAAQRSSVRTAGPGMPEPEFTPLEQFQQSPVVQALAGMPDSDVRLVERVGYTPQGHHRHLVAHRYEVLPREAADRAPLDVHLQLERRGKSGSEIPPVWRVDHFE